MAPIGAGAVNVEYRTRNRINMLLGQNQRSTSQAIDSLPSDLSMGSKIPCGVVGLGGKYLGKSLHFRFCFVGGSTEMVKAGPESFSVHSAVKSNLRYPEAVVHPSHSGEEYH